MAADGTQARILMAEAIHKAPAHRRDLIHLQLLRRARKIKSTLDLLDAVIGTDADRAAWLADREEWKIRDLMAWRYTQKNAAAEGSPEPLQSPLDGDDDCATAVTPARDRPRRGA